jgi:hypothetical protein
VRAQLRPGAKAATRRWLPGEDPVGRFVLANGVRVEIVGVVSDMRLRDVREPPVPQLFMPYAQRAVRVVVRTATDPADQIPAISPRFSPQAPGLRASSRLGVRQDWIRRGC